MNNTTPAEYLKRFKEITDKMYEITSRKNHDYSWTQFAFKNFMQIEQLTDWYTTTEEGIVVRITDKLSRLCTLLDKQWQVNDERIEDTLLDMANYCIILAIYLETKDSSQ